MKTLLLYLFNWRHDYWLDQFHTSKYTSDRDVQNQLWKKVELYRKRIGWITCKQCKQ